MVLVVFGNAPVPFPRLAKAVSTLCENSPRRWVVQRGYTIHDFPGAEVYDFVSAKEMKHLMEETAVVISHGGYGTISEVVRSGRKIIAVPRLEGEHNHSQMELVKAMERGGHILAAYDVADLGTKLEKSETFTPKSLSKGDVARQIKEFIAANFPSHS